MLSCILRFVIEIIASRTYQACAESEKASTRFEVDQEICYAVGLVVDYRYD